MFLHARSARRPTLHLSAASLSPIFRERCLSVLAKGQLARANDLSINAAARKETLNCLKELSTTSTIGTSGILNRLKELSTTTIGTAGITSISSGELSPSSNDIHAIESDLGGAFGETITLQKDVDSLPYIPASDTESMSATKHMTYPPPSRTYAALKGLKEVNGGKEPRVELTNSFSGPVQLALDTIEPAFNIVELAIPDTLPLDNDTEFTIIDDDVDTPSTPAVLVQNADVESDDVNSFVLIPREAGDTLSEQPNSNDGGDDWVSVNA